QSGGSTGGEERPLEKEPSEAELSEHFRLGIAAYDSGDWARAEKHLSQVTRWRPEYVQGDRRVEDLLADAGQRARRRAIGGGAFLLAAILLVGLISFLLANGPWNQRAAPVMEALPLTSDTPRSEEHTS